MLFWACGDSSTDQTSTTGGGGSSEGGGGGGGAGGAPVNPLDVACTPTFELDLKDKGPGGQLFLDTVGDPELFAQEVGRGVCRVLYRDASEVREANHLKLIIQQDEVPGWKAGDVGNITVMISSSHLLSIQQGGGDVLAEVTGVLSHEMTHMYQNDDKHPGEGSYENLGNVIEGVADAVRFRRGFVSSGAQPQKGGSWDDQGYAKPAFFILWIDNAHPGFLYQLNASMLAGDGMVWTPDTFADITGESVDALWSAYLTSGCCIGSNLGCCS